jgi:hypothetical protein
MSTVMSTVAIAVTSTVMILVMSRLSRVSRVAKHYPITVLTHHCTYHCTHHCICHCTHRTSLDSSLCVSVLITVLVTVGEKTLAAGR